MKNKILLCLLIIVIITGCKNKSNRTIEDLLDDYVKAYTKADLKTTMDIFPTFYVEYAKEYMTEDYLQKSLTKAKEVYGDDFGITYEITKATKLTDEELDELNKKMADNFNTADEATECYKYEGTITFKGTKKSDSTSISTMAYCKYSGNWYLVRK